MGLIAENTAHGDYWDWVIVPVRIGLEVRIKAGKEEEEREMTFKYT